jgi:hypothetical protein
MSQPSTEDQEKLGLLPILCGMHEAWKEARRARAIERKAARAARAQAAQAAAQATSHAGPAGSAAAALASAGASSAGAANGLSKRRFAAVALDAARKAAAGIPGMLRKTRAALAALSAFFVIWAFGALASATGASVYVSGYEWVAINAKTAEMSQATAIRMKAGMFTLSQGDLIYKEKEEFYRSYAVSAPSCFSSGACQQIDLDWKSWTRWALTGKPDAQLARLGWKAQAPISLVLDVFPMTSLVSALALLGAFVCALVFLARQRAAKKAAQSFAVARVLAALEGWAFVGAIVFAVFWVPWLVFGLGSEAFIWKSDAASPTWTTIVGVSDGSLSPEHAMWRNSAAAVGAGASDDDVTAVQNCIDSGFCAPTVSDEKKETAKPSARVLANRAAARRAMYAAEMKGVWGLSWPLQGLAIAIWLAFLCLALPMEREDCSQMEERLKSWDKRGRPRVERATLLAQAKRGQRQAKAARGASAPAPKRRPKAL